MCYKSYKYEEYTIISMKFEEYTATFLLTYKYFLTWKESLISSVMGGYQTFTTNFLKKNKYIWQDCEGF
jgi:hypothetical protein